MKTKILISLCIALSLCVEVYAEGEQEVKRGLFPFMAFIYYPDESIVDGTGARFLRGAVLLQPDWLITSAVGSSSLAKDTDGFPQKTLLARVGAITIDANFTLNEDEDEQEREVIQIVRPYNHSATQWWHTDISLMKTLLPFNITPSVGVTMLANKHEEAEKTCFILVYAKKDGNWTENRNLMQLTVDMLPPSVANCGHHFIPKTMSCAADSDESKNAVYDPNFCQDNRGSPLVCDGNVIGIQTYIDNDCKQPHLYQMLSVWETFITCSTGNKCQEEQCANICDVVSKDQDSSDLTTTADPVVRDITTVKETITTISTEPFTHFASYETTTEIQTLLPNPTVTLEEHVTVEQTTVDQISPTERAIIEQTTTEFIPSTKETTVTKSWPNEKYVENARKTPEPGSNRKPDVEAKQHDTKEKMRSAGQKCIQPYFFLWILYFGMFDLMFI